MFMYLEWVQCNSSEDICATTVQFAASATFYYDCARTTRSETVRSEGKSCLSIARCAGKDELPDDLRKLVNVANLISYYVDT